MDQLLLRVAPCSQTTVSEPYRKKINRSEQRSIANGDASGAARMLSTGTIYIHVPEKNFNYKTLILRSTSAMTSARYQRFTEGLVRVTAK